MTTQHRRLAWLTIALMGLSGLLWILRGGTRVERRPGPVPDARAAVPRDLETMGEPLQAAPALTETPSSQADRAQMSEGEPPDGRLALSVLVLDPSRNPIAGARVQAFDAAVPETRATDEHGRCRFFVFAADEPVRLRAEADGWVHSSAEYDRRTPAEFQLWPAARVRGRVLAEGERAAVAGARISLQHSSCDGCGPERVVSGPDGSFELPEVPCLATAVLAVEAEGFVPIERLEFLLPHSEAVVEQDLHLVRGLEVHGLVRDWITLAGIPAARVAGLVTDAEGRFHGRVAADPGTTQTRLKVSAAGHATLEAPVDLAQDELEFRLPALVTLEGEVTDRGGVPLQGASVSLRDHGPTADENGTLVESSPLYELPPGHGYSWHDTFERTDARGRFRLFALPWSLNVELGAALDGYQPCTRVVHRLGEPGSTQSAYLALAPLPSDGAWIEGHVLLNGLSTRAGGVVSWQGASQSGEARFEHGRFEFPIEPGDVELRFQLGDVSEVLEGAELSVHVRPEGHTYCTALLRVAGAKISGRVRFAGGSPVPRADVVAVCGDELVLTEGTTDERGEFALEVADVGKPYRLHVSWLELEQEREGIVPGSSQVEFVLADCHRVLVRVLDEATGTRLVPGRHVQLFARTRSRLFVPVTWIERTPDLAGWHEVWLDERRVDLLAKPVQRVLAGYGYGLVRGVELVTADGRPPRVEFALRRAPALVLELDARGGPWPEDHELLLVEEDLLGEIYRKPDGLDSRLPALDAERRIYFDGRRAELAGLAPGRYRFVVWPADLALDPPEVVVDRENVLPVPLRWTPMR